MCGHRHQQRSKTSSNIRAILFLIGSSISSATLSSKTSLPPSVYQSIRALRQNQATSDLQRVSTRVLRRGEPPSRTRWSPQRWPGFPSPHCGHASDESAAVAAALGVSESESGQGGDNDAASAEASLGIEKCSQKGMRKSHLYSSI